jgi:HlyD family secretion protein
MYTSRVWLLLSLLAAVLSACTGTATPAANPTALPPISGAATGGTVIAEGRVAPVQYAQLSVGGVGGVVSELPVQPGQAVKAGDVLLRVQGAELEAALTQAQAGLSAAEARLAQAQNPGARPSDLAAAQAQVALAQANVDRLAQAPQPWQLSAARAAVASAQAAYTAAKQAAGAAGPQLDAAYAALEKATVNLKVAQQNYDLIAYLPSASATPQAQALQNATIDYQQAKANYDALAATSGPDAQARVSQAATQLAQAVANLHQLEQPYTDADRSTAQANLDLAKANLARLTEPAGDSDLAILQAGVEQARAGVAQAQAAVDNLALRAPFDGMVADLPVKVGERVSPGQAAVVLADDSSWVVETKDLTELAVAKVKEGQAVSITLAALPDVTLSGTVTSIARVYVERQGDVTYLVKIAITEANPDLRWGMTAAVTFEP